MLLDVPSAPFFPEVFGIDEREQDYREFSINGWPGALGVDSVIVAYDALLSTLDYCNREQESKANKWEEACLRGMLHGGDSDSTGTIVGAWYGALYGFEDVFEANMVKSENREFL
jgi:ADP-ribosylarginine hydrolase